MQRSKVIINCYKLFKRQSRSKIYFEMSKFIFVILVLRISFALCVVILIYGYTILIYTNNTLLR